VAKKPSKLATGCVIITTIIAATILFVGYPFHSPTALKISFVAFTNDATSSFLAVFTVTNESSKNITFEPCKPQLKKQNVWSKLDFSGGDMTNIPAHTNVTFTIPLITNCEAWREPVFWAYDSTPSKIENIRGNIKANLYFNWLRISRGGWPRYYNGIYSTAEDHTIFSPEITNNPVK